MTTNIFEKIKFSAMRQYVPRSTFLMLFFLFTSIGTLAGQMEINDINNNNNNRKQMPRIPSLDSLIITALEHSKQLKVQDKRIEITAKERQLMKKDLLDKVSIGGSLVVGTGTIYDAWSDGENPQDFTSYRRNVGANSGLQVRISIGDVVKNKQKQELATLQFEQKLLERSTIEQQIREEVFRRYDDFVYFQNLIDIKAANLEAMRLSLEIVEKYFKEGNVAVTEYTTVLSKKIKAEEELETTKARALHAWRILKDYCGI